MKHTLLGISLEAAFPFFKWYNQINAHLVSQTASLIFTSVINVIIDFPIICKRQNADKNKILSNHLPW